MPLLPELDPLDEQSLIESLGGEGPLPSTPMPTEGILSTLAQGVKNRSAREEMEKLQAQIAKQQEQEAKQQAKQVEQQRKEAERNQPQMSVTFKGPMPLATSHATSAQLEPMPLVKSHATAPPAAPADALQGLRSVVDAGGPQQPVTSLPRPPVLSARKAGSERPMPPSEGDELLKRAGNLPELLNQTQLGVVQDFTDPLSMVDMAAAPLASLRRVVSPQALEKVTAREGIEDVRLSDLLKYMRGWQGPEPKKVSTPMHSLMERSPVEMVGDRYLMSNRVPTAVKAPVMPEGQALVSGLDEILASPELTRKIAAKARTYPLLTQEQGKLSDRGVLDALVDSLQQNNEYLLKQFDEFVPRSRKWYDGAHRLSNEIAQEFGYHPNQSSGVLAVLSPQKDWHQNVELAKRVTKNHKLFTETDMPFSREMGEQYIRTQLSSTEEMLDTGKNKVLPETVKNQFRALVGQMSERRVRRMNGRAWSDLSLSDRAVMLRSFDEMQFGRKYPILTPEGDILKPMAMTKEGEEGAFVWQSYKEIAKAISILDDGSAENISRNLGLAHKVRAFYNNINVPNYGRSIGQRGSSTVDTHAVAAGHLQPFGSSAPEVDYVMGGVGDAMAGVTGANPIYQEAIARSGKAHKLNLLPREAQSPEWEALKGLFDPAKKRNKNFKGNIEKVWDEYNKGRLSLEEVQDAIFNEASGIPTPEWAGKP